MAAILFRNVQVWDGSADDRFPARFSLQAPDSESRPGRGARSAAASRRERRSHGSGPHADARPRRRPLPPCSLLQPDAQSGSSARSPLEEHVLKTCRNATFILNHGFTSCYSARLPRSSESMSSCGSGDPRTDISQGPAAHRAAGPEITVTGGLGDERKQHIHAESFGMIADGPTECMRKAVRPAAARASTM